MCTKVSEQNMKVTLADLNERRILINQEQVSMYNIIISLKLIYQFIVELKFTTLNQL